ncbi:MAG: TIGR03915 family putative DNA repair protein [Treponema sp.]|jgi:hypothetical protein|nr:TIGR03915 family putative DNA repair protein [Treponema sp.]
MIPTELSYDGTLEALFALLDRLRSPADAGEQDLPRRLRRLAPAWAGLSPGQGNSPKLPAPGGLFDEPLPAYPEARPAFPAFPPDPAALGGAARDLFAVSADAFGAFVSAWMSELPVDGSILRFGRKVLAGAERAAGISAAVPSWTGREAARAGAARAAGNRGDGDVRAVMAAAYKADHEINRLMGFLRFSPDPRWVYLARCAPDGFVIPALAGHFSLRFGEEPWAIIDEKRGILLLREAGREARLLPAAAPLPCPVPACRGHEPRDGDPWEKLWLQYHKSVSNEARQNPGLQRRFMPERYWKYLPELSDKARR